MKYVTEFILLGQATEIRSRVISRLVCAILPTWRNARLKPYARYYPPLPYATLCIGACTALASCTQRRPHSFLQRRRARPARECRMWELLGTVCSARICVSRACTAMWMNSKYEDAYLLAWVHICAHSLTRWVVVPTNRADYLFIFISSLFYLYSIYLLFIFCYYYLFLFFCYYCCYYYYYYYYCYYYSFVCISTFLTTSSSS